MAQQLGSATALSMRYDSVGMLTEAGALIIQHDPATARLTGTTIGVTRLDA